MKSKRITKLFFFVFLSFSIFIEGVKAEESINISSNSTIKYKWYIEEKVDEKVEEGKEKFDQKKEKYEERKEKGKNIADNVINDFYKSIDEFKESIKRRI